MKPNATLKKRERNKNMTSKKKLLTVFIAAVVCVLLAGCDAKRGYDSVLNQIQSPVIAREGKPDPQPVTEPEVPETVPETKPETTPDNTKTPDAATPPADDATYPKGVPAPAYLTLISEKWENDALFKAQYLMTKAQLTAWESALDAAKFSAGEPRGNGEWTLSVTKLAQSAGSKADYRVVIELTKSATAANAAAAWPSAFTMFPEFKGDGTVETEIAKDDSIDLKMILVSFKETKTAYTAYLATLKKAGFVDVGYGVYTKTETNRVLEVDTDSAWQDETTLRLTYIIRPNK